jgi:hypothetical protein
MIGAKKKDESMQTALKTTLTASLIAALATPSVAGGPVVVAEDEAVIEAPREGVNPLIVMAILGIALAVALDSDDCEGRGCRNSYRDTRR